MEGFGALPHLPLNVTFDPLDRSGMRRRRLFDPLRENSATACLSRRPSVGAELSGANLRMANLAGADLSGSDLRGHVLAAANLNGANLDGANLDGAKLPNLVRESRKQRGSSAAVPALPTKMLFVTDCENDRDRSFPAEPEALYPHTCPQAPALRSRRHRGTAALLFGHPPRRFER